uniref:Uncharacterized protein n=1 Tax=Rhizophora mucronata TaxID=61149 RepID=A0A2P2PQH1_RHIMU
MEENSLQCHTEIPYFSMTSYQHSK